jgi:hypothetical protein
VKKINKKQMKKQTNKEMKKQEKENRWRNNSFKYPKEVQFIYDTIIKRILELVEKYTRGNFNGATLPAFELGCMSDLDNCLDKLKLPKMEKK